MEKARIDNECIEKILNVIQIFKTHLENVKFLVPNSAKKEENSITNLIKSIDKFLSLKVILNWFRPFESKSFLELREDIFNEFEALKERGAIWVLKYESQKPLIQLQKTIRDALEKLLRSNKSTAYAYVLKYCVLVEWMSFMWSFNFQIPKTLAFNLASKHAGFTNLIVDEIEYLKCSSLITDGFLQILKNLANVSKDFKSLNNLMEKLEEKILKTEKQVDDSRKEEKRKKKENEESSNENDINKITEQINTYNKQIDELKKEKEDISVKIMERKEEFNLKIKNDNTEKLRDLEKIKAFECVLKYSEVDSLVKFSYAISIMNSMKKEQKKFQSIQSVSSVFLQKDYFTPDLLLLLSGIYFTKFDSHTQENFVNISLYFPLMKDWNEQKIYNSLSKLEVILIFYPENLMKTSILVIDKMNNQKPLLILYYSQDASKNEILCLNGIKSLISNYKTKIIEENIDYIMNEEVNNISICEKLMIKISYIIRKLMVNNKDINEIDFARSCILERDNIFKDETVEKYSSGLNQNIFNKIKTEIESLMNFNKIKFEEIYDESTDMMEKITKYNDLLINLINNKLKVHDTNLLEKSLYQRQLEILKQKNLKSFDLFEKFVKSKKFSPEKERLFSVYRESLEKCQKIVSYFTKFVLENSNDNLDKIFSLTPKFFEFVESFSEKVIKSMIPQIDDIKLNFSIESKLFSNWQELLNNFMIDFKSGGKRIIRIFIF